MSKTTDDFPQQISQLAPFLERNVSHLHAPSTAVLFLYCAILLNPELEDSCNDEQRQLLSATVAALRQQTVVLVSLLTETTFVDFSCYETQCAASTLMAFETYSQSNESLSLVFRSVTEPLLQLLQNRIPRQSISDNKMAERESNEHAQKPALYENHLNVYLTDLFEIVSALYDKMPNTIGYSHMYRAYSDYMQIVQRLLMLESPIAELVKKSRRGTTDSSIPSVVICKLTNRERAECTLKRLTVIDLLLYLLRVEAFMKERDRLRHSILKYVKHADAMK